jgi:hypothetical protein
MGFAQGGGMGRDSAERDFVQLLERDISRVNLASLASTDNRWAGVLRRVSRPLPTVVTDLPDTSVPEDLQACSVRIEFCGTRRQLALFRMGRQSQSVPSSERVGRRIKALVYLSTASTKHLVGGFELSSSMFYLKDRDTYLDWRGLPKEQRVSELRKSADLSLYFATPSFATVRGAKLVTLCAISDEVRQEFQRRYGDELEVVSSICASGRHSPVLNRLAFGGLRFKKVGHTGGTSLSHLSRETIRAARVVCGRGSDAYMDSNVRALNTVVDAIRLVGLSRRQYVDVAPPRAIYVARLPRNEPAPSQALFQWWMERWVQK